MKAAEAVRHLKAAVGDATITSESECCGQITLEVCKENLKPVLEELKKSPGLGYEVLMDLTGVDYLKPTKHTKVVYWLHNPTTYERLRIVVLAARDAAIPSVVDLWEGADWYERELYDLFGVNFEGRPNIQRLLMPDNWQGHPLRKDYALTEEPVEFKHGVKPKVPSEIIPYVAHDHRTF